MRSVTSSFLRGALLFFSFIGNSTPFRKLLLAAFLPFSVVARVSSFSYALKVAPFFSRFSSSILLLRRASSLSPDGSWDFLLTRPATAFLRAAPFSRVLFLLRNAEKRINRISQGEVLLLLLLQKFLPKPLGGCRWWFWVVVGLVIGGWVLGRGGGDPSSVNSHTSVSRDVVLFSLIVSLSPCQLPRRISALFPIPAIFSLPPTTPQTPLSPSWLRPLPFRHYSLRGSTFPTPLVDVLLPLVWRPTSIVFPSK